MKVIWTTQSNGVILEENAVATGIHVNHLQQIAAIQSVPRRKLSPSQL